MLPLPPLERLRAFQMAARLKSFTAAAEALYLTPSAVSHRIRALEAELGRQLFHRHGPSIELTDQGKALFGSVELAFDAIGSAWRVAGQPSRRAVRVSCAPLFAERFILPGLEKFNANSKGLGIAIECSHTRARLDAFECDVAIRLAARPDGDFACTPLLEVEAIVVASSKRVAGAARALPLLQGPLLAITHLRRAWHDAANFWNIELPEDVATVWFDSLETIVRQAEAGAGIALVPSILVATQLQEGRLERVPGLSAVPGPTYWWMTRKDMMADKDIKAFKKWVLQRLATVG